MIDNYFVFLVTTAIVVFSPGAAAIAVAGQGASNGMARAMFGVVGVASANVVYFVLSATGIASLLVASYFVFSLIKWVGVAYLIYLGLTALFSKGGLIQVGLDGKNVRAHVLFAHGFVVEFANPKALLYFAAIMPQFLDISRPILGQILTMGLTTLLIDLLAYSIYARLGDRLMRQGIAQWVVNLFNKSAGVALLFAGIKMASVGVKN